MEMEARACCQTVIPFLKVHDSSPENAILRPHLTHIPTVSVGMSATWRGTAPLTLTVGVKTPPNQSLSSLSNHSNSVKWVGLIIRAL